MTIVPIINVKNQLELDERLEVIGQIYASYPKDTPWVQIDVADGSFTNGYDNWRSPAELAQKKDAKKLKIEIDALLLDPISELEKWKNANISRFIFYLETIKDPEVIIGICKSYDIEPVLAITPSTSFKTARQYLALVESCQLLAVNPGKSGQKFNPETLDKIKDIKASFPKMSIQIDGGVDADSGTLAVKAGADRLSASSFIFSSNDPVRSYASLRELYYAQ